MPDASRPTPHRDAGAAPPVTPGGPVGRRTQRAAVREVEAVAGDGQQLRCQVRSGAAAESSDAPGDVVVFLPALGVPLRYYDTLLARWSSRGRTVVGVELRGQPLSPVRDLRRGDFGYSTMIRQDLPAVLALPEVREAHGTVLVGHSMGGVLALLATAAGAVTVSSVVTVATGASWCAVQSTPGGRARRHASAAFVAGTAAALGVWPGHRLGFAGRQPRTVMRDWAHEARHGRFVLHGDSTDYEGALSRHSTPTLMIGVRDDAWAPTRALVALGRRAPAGSVSYRTVQGTRALGHFSWARRAPDLLIDTTERWLGAA